MSKDIVERYQILAQQADQLKERRDKAQGALEHLLEELQEKFECDNLKDAETLLKKMQQKAKASSEAFEEAVEEFEDKWGDVLNEF